MMEKQFICCHKIGGMDNAARAAALPKSSNRQWKEALLAYVKAGVDAGQFVHKLFGIVIVL